MTFIDRTPPWARALLTHFCRLTFTASSGGGRVYLQLAGKGTEAQRRGFVLGPRVSAGGGGRLENPVHIPFTCAAFQLFDLHLLPFSS